MRRRHKFPLPGADIQSSAEAARVLDGFKPNGDAQFGMKVLISDPSIKAKRSDAQDSVVFIGGLNAKSTEQEVRDLLRAVSRDRGSLAGSFCADVISMGR